ncbi:MAG: TRAP transporter large permease [Oscillospiraceae bacterium]|nr:TRAP transporter large permease [Oscillospiraceae bacterium]
MAYMALVLLLIFLVIMLLGTPVGFGMGALTVIAFKLLGGDLSMIPQKMFSGIDVYTYVCILLFILSADIMSVGGITRAIVIFCERLVGHIRGGLAHVNVLASMLFAGLSGSAAADAAGLGPIEIQMMTEGGYDKEFSSAVTAASAIIGPIIPPSNIMIIYAGCVGTVSVGKMFMAGAIPGILLGIAYMAFCYYISLKRKYPCREKRASGREIARATWETLPALLLPIIIMGTITLGICTATESSAIAVVYSTIVALCRRQLSFKSFWRACIRSAKAAANVLFIIAIATAMAWAITTLGVAQALTNFCMAYINNKYLFLLFVNILLLLIGMLLDASPALLLMVPILWPVARAFGISDIHFGVMVCFNLMVGTLTPPVGMMLFIVSNVGKVKLSVMYKVILPFVVVAVVVLILITYIPSLTTWLPAVLMK